MRAGLKPEIIKNGDDFLGFNLSAGYCAEHECGIVPLKEALGLDPADFQMDCEDFSGFHFAESGGSERVAILAFLKHKEFYKTKELLPMHGDHPRKFRSFSRELYTHGHVAAMWSDSEFVILVKGQDLIAELKNLYAALLINDACVWVNGSSNPFGRGGLCVAVSSRLSDEIKEGWRKHHADRIRLMEASKATGIEQRLREAGKSWFALSPSWIEEAESESRHPVRFWLNPIDQDENNFGWYTVEQLDQWALGKGPVVKEKANVR